MECITIKHFAQLDSVLKIVMLDPMPVWVSMAKRSILCY